MEYYKKFAISVYLIILAAVTGCGEDENIVAPSPVAETKFFISDIELFWQTFDSIDPSFTSAKFQELYINKGTAGLKDYAVQKNLAADLQGRLSSEAYLDYYKAVRENTLNLDSTIEVCEGALAKLKEEYSGAKDHHVYFIIGALSSGGRISNNGILIAAEMFSKPDSFSLSGLNEWHRSVIRSKRFLPSLVVHEQIHLHQTFRSRNPGFRTLLEQSIKEGMADYISNYLLNGESFMNYHLHRFADSIEEKIWNEFDIEKDKDYRATEWLYTGSTTAKGYPADLGYYMGYKILDAFAEKQVSMSAAIEKMLTTSDYYKLFEESGYSDKFK